MKPLSSLLLSTLLAACALSGCKDRATETTTTTTTTSEPTPVPAPAPAPATPSDTITPPSNATPGGVPDTGTTTTPPATPAPATTPPSSGTSGATGTTGSGTDAYGNPHRDQPDNMPKHDTPRR
jgi:hypothetical protein